MNLTQPATISKKLLRQGLTHLRDCDPRMAALIEKHPTCPFHQGDYQPFHTLTSSIIGQQISKQAADAIRKRIGALAGFPFQAERIVLQSDETLRLAGLSGAKVRYIRAIAECSCSGTVDFAALVLKSDEEVIETLCELPGIGRWSAEMFLMFALRRPNVLALGDAGLQRAAKLLYGSKRTRSQILHKVARPWQPYRSIASWYLWRHLGDLTAKK